MLINFSSDNQSDFKLPGPESNVAPIPERSSEDKQVSPAEDPTDMKTTNNERSEGEWIVNVVAFAMICLASRCCDSSHVKYGSPKSMRNLHFIFVTIA